MERILPQPKVVSCPVCGFPLRGATRTGYRCLKCHAHYSTRFVRHLRRAHLRDLIATHFDARPQHATTAPPPATTTDAATLHIPEAEVVRALSEAKAAVQGATQHLEDFLDLSQPDVIERLKSAAPQTPQEAIGPTPTKQAYAAPSRKATHHARARRPQAVRRSPTKKAVRRKPAVAARKKTARTVTRRRR